MVNYIALLVATVVSYAMGMLWYSPILFGKTWMRLTKVRSMKITLWIFIGGILSAFVLCYVLAFVIQFSGVQTFIDGALIGVLLWLGFVATLSLEKVLHEKTPWELYWINTIYHLIAMFVSGGILAIWQ